MSAPCVEEERVSFFFSSCVHKCVCVFFSTSDEGAPVGPLGAV